jgi:hypothetical protein
MDGSRQSALRLARLRFARDLGKVLVLWLALSGLGLGIGIVGYMATENMQPIDAFLNAAMILSGMGPVSELSTRAGKIFAGCYALFSGLFLVVATGFLLAPMLHHVLHHFHLEEGKKDDD